MLKAIRPFQQFHLELHVKNDDEGYDDGDDYVLFPSGCSMSDSLLRALHTYCHFITQQPPGVVLP